MFFLGRKERLSLSNPSKSTLLVHFVSWNFNMLSGPYGDFSEHCTVQPWDQSWEHCGIVLTHTGMYPDQQATETSVFAAVVTVADD